MSTATDKKKTRKKNERNKKKASEMRKVEAQRGLGFA